MSLWHTNSLNVIRNLLEPDLTVRGLVVYGSFAAGSHDELSDLDLLVVTNDLKKTHFFSNLEWLSSLGDIFAVERSVSELTKLARITFSDLRRIDLLITDEYALQTIEKWPSVSFSDPAERSVIFSRSIALDRIFSISLVKAPYTPPSFDHLNQMVESFWHKCALALIKLARNDRLIAFHLTLSAVQDCCVLSMIMRDKEKNTNHHRYGSIGNEHLDTLAEIDATPVGIISTLQKAARLFDQLAGNCIEEYINRAEKFVALLDSRFRGNDI